MGPAQALSHQAAGLRGRKRRCRGTHREWSAPAVRSHRGVGRPAVSRSGRGRTSTTAQALACRFGFGALERQQVRKRVIDESADVLVA